MKIKLEFLYFQQKNNNEPTEKAELSIIYEGFIIGTILQRLIHDYPLDIYRSK